MVKLKEKSMIGNQDKSFNWGIFRSDSKKKKTHSSYNTPLDILVIDLFLSRFLWTNQSFTRLFFIHNQISMLSEFILLLSNSPSSLFLQLQKCQTWLQTHQTCFLDQFCTQWQKKTQLNMQHACCCTSNNNDLTEGFTEITLLSLLWFHTLPVWQN